jgi:hypothetical protein
VLCRRHSYTNPLLTQRDAIPSNEAVLTWGTNLPHLPKGLRKATNTLFTLAVLWAEVWTEHLQNKSLKTPVAEESVPWLVNEFSIGTAYEFSTFYVTLASTAVWVALNRRVMSTDCLLIGWTRPVVLISLWIGLQMYGNRKIALSDVDYSIGTDKSTRRDPDTLQIKFWNISTS